ncbi:MAG TPA: ABC transporter permease [Rhizobiaceae bacterium]|nr:ABC transporter permease [Rhizobiaceae bacterium]
MNWKVVFREYSRDITSLLALAALSVALLLAIFASVIAVQDPYDLTALNLMDSRLPPGSIGENGLYHLLGTDDQGRDVASAILYGLRISIGVAVASGAIGIVLGTAVGILAAYLGGWADAVLMRIVDIQLSFPAILNAMILLAVFGTGLLNIIIALVAVQWAYYARTARSAALVELGREYVEAAKSLSFGPMRIMFRHILPNCLGPLLVIAAVELANAIALEASLSFLGTGLRVTEPSLGLLIANGYSLMLSGHYWLTIYPGLALLILVASANLIADGLRRAFISRSAVAVDHG